MTENRLFISHANEDEEVVNRIVSYLEARGVPCWIAGRDIPPRAIYAEAITKAIQECTACSVIISTHANVSAPIKRELELASHHGKPFIPIRVDESEPGPGLDYYLRNTQWINYNREGDRALDRIAKHLDPNASAPTPTATPQTRPQPAYQPRYEQTTPPVEPRRSGNSAMPIIAAIAIGVIVIGAWLIVSNMNQPTEEYAATEEAITSSPEEYAQPAPDPTPAPDDSAEIQRLQRELQIARGEANEAERARIQAEIDAARIQADQDRQRQQQQQQQQVNNAALIGRWSTGEANRGVQTIEFRSDGTLSNYTLGWTGIWSRQGSQYRFTFNEEPSYYYLGSVSGGTYSGVVYNSDGSLSEYTFTFSRE